MPEYICSELSLSDLKLRRGFKCSLRVQYVDERRHGVSWGVASLDDTVAILTNADQHGRQSNGRFCYKMSNVVWLTIVNILS